MKAPPLADDVKMEVKRFHDRISASTESHPVNFDDVWALAGYSRKNNAKRALRFAGESRGPALTARYFCSTLS